MFPLFIWATITQLLLISFSFSLKIAMMGYEEITLRKYQLSDVDHFMNWACDPEVLRFSRLQAWVQPDSSRAQILGYFSDMLLPNPFNRAICLAGRPIGLISIEPQGAGANDFHRGRAKLSYAIGRHYWGRGSTTNVVRRAVSGAFEDIPGLLRIEAFSDPNNKGSLRVLEKVGFLKEGLLRKYMIVDGEGVDYLIYSLLSTDPIMDAT